MKHVNFFSIFACIFFLSLCAICAEAQPLKGGLRVRPSASALHPRIAITRFIAQAQAKNPPHISLRTLPVSVLSKNVPAFPLQSHPNEMYRGLALDMHGKELRTILKEGMPVETSHYPIKYGAYDGKPYRDDTKVLFATTDPLLAATYAKTNRFRNDGPLFLPVILHLKRVGKDIAPGEERTVEIPHDIPPSWIYKVSALLNVEGQLLWGELKLDGEEGFLFSPYPLSKTEKRFLDD